MLAGQRLLLSWTGSFFQCYWTWYSPAEENFLLSSYLYLETVPLPGGSNISESCLLARCLIDLFLEHQQRSLLDLCQELCWTLLPHMNPMVGPWHLLKIRFCFHLPNPIYSLYFGIKMSWFTEVCIPGYYLHRFYRQNKHLCVCLMVPIYWWSSDNKDQGYTFHLMNAKTKALER